MYSRKSLLRRLGDVGRGGWIETEVAYAAILHIDLAEVSADRGRAATGTVKHGIKLAQLAHLHRFDSVVDIAAVDATPGPGKIGGGIKRDAFRGCTVATGASDLLPIGFDRCRRICVDHIAYVGLIDAHAESDGGHHDGCVCI